MATYFEILKKYYEEWQEPINEEELDELADEYADHAEMTRTLLDGYNTDCWDYLDIVEAFKAGYRKALNIK